MGIELAFIISTIALLALLFFAGRFLLRINLRNRGEKHFVPLVILSIIGYAAMLCATPYAWLLLGILLSGNNFSR
jgi:hypothetical protein